MEFIELEIPGILLIKPMIFTDDRGSFFESFKLDLLLKKIDSNLKFCQDNQSKSHKDVLRGLHLQNPPFEQGKLVRVVKGCVDDVVVDVRKESAHYGKHLQVELNDENNHMLWIPPGFAHGFITRNDNTIFLYKCTSYYDKNSETGILWNDPDLAINWNVTDPIVSEKDNQLPLLSEFNSSF